MGVDSRLDDYRIRWIQDQMIIRLDNKQKRSLQLHGVSDIED